jgi:hypothetical protein
MNGLSLRPIEGRLALPLVRRVDREAGGVGISPGFQAPPRAFGATLPATGRVAALSASAHLLAASA